MSYQYPTPRRAAPLDALANIAIIVIVIVVGTLAWPVIIDRLWPHVAPNQVAAPVLVGQPRPAPPAPYDAAAANAESLRQYQATATAANAASGPLPNVDVTGDAAPVLRESKPSARTHITDNVPTAEPITEPQVSDAFGSKAIPVDIQETHTCLHGQQWTDAGCRNPVR